MKRNSFFAISIAVLSIIDGYLLSAISLVGRAGISIIYTQYQFLRSWWKGALFVFIVWMILFLFQLAIKTKLSRTTAAILQIAFLLAAITGFALSYSDFHNSLSHHLLGPHFHFGVYLFWVGWIGISIFLLLQKKSLTEEIAIKDNLSEKANGR